MSVNPTNDHELINPIYLQTFAITEIVSIDFDTPTHRLTSALTGRSDRSGLAEFANLLQQVSDTFERGLQANNAATE